MTLRERFEQLEDRERKLLLIFGAVVAFMFVLIIPTYATMSVGEQRGENERIYELIREIKDERVTLGRRKAETKRVESRYARNAPALASFLAQAADQVGVEIPETQDRSTIPAGKTYKERSTKIRLRSVGLLALSNFLEKVDNGGYPISISRLNIKKRGTKPDEYDVEMEVSAFDREESKKKTKASEKDESDEN
jgi:general secretion pathway protein M